MNVQICKSEEYNCEPDICVIRIEGAVNSSSVHAFDQFLSELPLKEYRALIIDCENLEYISSAGLRSLLKIKKKINDFMMFNVNASVYDVLDLTGLTEIFDVLRNLRKISVAKCPLIAKGGRGKVYRLTEDTICKVSLGFSSARAIHNEIVQSRAAMIAGIPCAFSYDMVECEEGLGLVYEMLNADTMGKCFRNEDRFDELIRLYVNTVKNVTETEIISNKLPESKEIYYPVLDASKEKLGEERIGKFHEILDAVPDLGTFNHNDFHGNNVMVTGDEILLIDMADASIGHPIYDLCTIANAYSFCAQPQGVPDEVYEERYSVPKATGKKIWKNFCALYFEGLPEQVKADRIRTVEIMSVIFTIKYLDEVLQGGNLPEAQKEEFMNMILLFTDGMLKESEFIIKTVKEWE